ncbi:hypothetical protein G9A89_020545 [Geosiphon pyriformis]|nr:hypothetical protein G9A89_020545 [Geosiphon pyriformis]
MAEFLCKNPLKIDLFPEPLDLSLLNAEDLSSRKNSKIPSALTIEKVFTPEECQQLINLSEKSKYEPALVNIGHGQQKLMTDVRDSSRYIRDDSELSLKFGAELNPLYPQFGKVNRCQG